jgi:hypothetical protein
MGRILIFVIFLLGCNEDQSGDQQNETSAQTAEVGEPFVISKKEIARFEILSQGGDGRASYALFMHYSFNSLSQGDRERANYWLRKASSQGYSKATDLLHERAELR